MEVNSNNSFFFYFEGLILIPKATILWCEANMIVQPYVVQLEMGKRKWNVSWPEMEHNN